LAFVESVRDTPPANQSHVSPSAIGARTTVAWFGRWLGDVAPTGRPVVVVGFSAGAAFVGGLILSHPARYVGAVLLSGTLPFDADVAATPGRLAGLPVLVIQGERDTVIPRELLDRTWQYLTGDSGADALAVRHPGAHAISEPALTELSRWLTDLLTTNHTTRGRHQPGH
jgi:phospholipase/carboxylesterase